MSFKPIPKKIKDQILFRVKEGIPVAQFSCEHGISPKTIYGWLSKLAEKHPAS